SKITWRSAPPPNRDHLSRKERLERRSVPNLQPSPEARISRGASQSQGRLHRRRSCPAPRQRGTDQPARHPASIQVAWIKEPAHIRTRATRSCVCPLLASRDPSPAPTEAGRVRSAERG